MLWIALVVPTTTIAGCFWLIDRILARFDTERHANTTERAFLLQRIQAPQIQVTHPALDTSDDTEPPAFVEGEPIYNEQDEILHQAGRL